MCYYCDNKKEPMRKPIVPKDIDFHQMFEHPPVNYARYGLQVLIIMCVLNYKER